MIKFTICILKPRRGGDLYQSDVIMHKDYLHAVIYDTYGETKHV